MSTVNYSTGGERPHAGRPHRIALCITDLDPGGAERFAVELAARLDRSLFAPAVYCLAAAPVGPGEALVARLATAGVSVEFLGARGIFDLPAVLLRLRAALRERRPAIVQTFLWHANVLGPLAARGIRGEQNRRRAAIVTGLRVAEPRRRWRWPLERWAGRWVDRHLAVSEGVARFAIERVGLPAEKIVVISNGIEIDRFPASPADPESLGVRRGRRFLLCVGRLSRDDQKGIAGLLEHVPRLLGQLEAYDLVVVGDGPMFEPLRRRTAELGLQDRVHWLGWRGDVPTIIAAGEMLLSPSQWEGMSNVVMEAMASGKPVVLQAAEGTTDLLDDHPEQVAAAGDWPNFLARIAKLAADPALRAKLGAINRERIESRFRFEQVVARYERLYLELLEGGSAVVAR